LGAGVYLETPVPPGRDWPLAWDSCHELGAYAASVKALRAQGKGRDGTWFPALDESGGHGSGGVGRYCGPGGGGGGGRDTGAEDGGSANNDGGLSTPLGAAWLAGQQAWLSGTGLLVQPGGLVALVLGDGGGVCGLKSARAAALVTECFEEVASATIRNPGDGSGDAAAGGGGSNSEQGVQSTERNGKVTLTVGDQRPQGGGSRSYPGNRRTEHILVLRRTGR
jgi:hypothetical protein